MQQLMKKKVNIFLEDQQFFFRLISSPGFWSYGVQTPVNKTISTTTNSSSSLSVYTPQPFHTLGLTSYHQ